MQRYGEKYPTNNNNTYALAKFLATTGPEEFKRTTTSFDNDPQQLIKMVPFHYNNNKGNNFFDRLRKKKKPSTNNLKNNNNNNNNNKLNKSNWSKPILTNNNTTHSSSTTTTSSSSSSSSHHQLLQKNNHHKKHIPLIIDESNQPYYYHYLHQPQLKRSKTIDHQEKEIKTNNEEIHSFPTPPTSSMHDFVIDESINELKGLRHIEVQTDDIVEEYNEEIEEEKNDEENQLLKRIFIHQVENEGKERCHHCCRPFQQYTIERLQRRKSSPASLSSGAKIKLGQEATVLLALIEQLKQQLAEEQQSRKLLEKTIQLQFLEKAL